VQVVYAKQYKHLSLSVRYTIILNTFFLYDTRGVHPLNSHDATLLIPFFPFPPLPSSPLSSPFNRDPGV